MSLKDPQFEDNWKTTAAAVDEYMRHSLSLWHNSRSAHTSGENGLNQLFKSMEYSLLSDGKRFRPVLCLWTYKMLSNEVSKALPLAMAIECIHCYSLIHDDLPSMDNDDFRRGRPTNHKVFGDALALLAGNSLLTYAFEIIADSYFADPEVAVKLVKALTASAGAIGMVGGQAIDIDRQDTVWTVNRLEKLHSMKTGALIALSVESAGILAKVSEQERQALVQFGNKLGLAFQVADDLLDYHPEKPEVMNFATLLGVEKATSYLKKISDEAIQSLRHLGPAATPLVDMVNFNFDRKK